MDNQILVHILHRGADLPEQRDPLGDRQAVAIAILIDRRALDVIHHEVRFAVGR